MTTTTDTSTDESTPVLLPRTRRTSAAEWALFTDWCATTDITAQPADPRVVVDFLQPVDAGAEQGTRRRGHFWSCCGPSG